MSEKSNKNLLVLILSVSAILFIGAYFYTQANVDNSEAVTIPNSNVKSADTKKPKKDLSFLDEDFVDARVQNRNDEIIANQQELKEKLSEKLNMHLIYKTPEAVMKSIVYYQEAGNQTEVDRHIKFLAERFPDYEMPSDF